MGGEGTRVWAANMDGTQHKYVEHDICKYEESNMFVLERKVALIFGTSGDKKSLCNSENDLFCTGCLYVQPLVGTMPNEKRT